MCVVSPTATAPLCLIKDLQQAVLKLGCPSLLLYYTTKIVVCQYAIRNFFYENRNIFSFCVLIYYGKRDTMSKRKGVKTYDKVQSQSDACPAGDDPKELAEKTGIRPPTVSAICVGSVKHLPGDALEKICDVLDCQPADLMEYVRDGVQE